MNDATKHSGPVDVLAELDALIVIRASRAAKDGAPLTAIGDLRRAEATLAAVAELIEALAGLVSIEDSVTQGQERERREEWLPKARAALANVGSAS